MSLKVSSWFLRLDLGNPLLYTQIASRKFANAQHSVSEQDFLMLVLPPCHGTAD